MDHGEIQELAPGYALGRLTPEERLRFEPHAAVCPECAMKAREYRMAAAWLPLVVEQETPPLRLKARIMEQARREIGLQNEPAPQHRAEGAPGRRGWFPRRAWSAGSHAPYAVTAALALFVVIGLAVWDLHLYFRTADQSETITQLRESTVIAVARGTNVQPDASGEVVWLEKQGLTVLRVRGLALLPAGKTYQVWLIKDGVPASAGLFEVRDPGTKTEAVISGQPDHGQTLAVTIERAGGVPLPTGDIVLKADL